VSTPPTAAPPSWLEAAAKLDAIAADRVPLAAAPAPKAEAPAPPKPAAPEAKPRPRVSAPPVIVPDGPADAREETEIGWYGYAAATLLPGTLALAALTAAAVVSLRPRVPPTIMREAVDAPLAALWLVQTIRAAYRVLAYHCRLTTRRLFHGRGRLYPPEPPLDLATVANASARQTLLGRLLGVGTVRVVPEDGAERPAVELTGVRRPRMLAAAIEQAATAAREENVVAVRAGQESLSGNPATAVASTRSSRVAALEAP
jgi:hypothetical protein